MNFKYIFQILYALLSVLPISSSHAATIVESLPGYPGILPFKLETGYIGVGEEEEVQLFYYFIESERDPKRDPLLLWLTGGHGCSGFSGLVLEIGPLFFNFSEESMQSEVPKFELNSDSWTKASSIIFVDWPVGAGFSYSVTPEGCYTDDITTFQQLYVFLKKWVANHPKFEKNSIYISGDSYSGIPVPIIVQEIINGNANGNEPPLNIKGYILGNPMTIQANVTNAKYKFAQRVSLLSDELYKLAKVDCDGNYDNVDQKNIKCINVLQAITQNLDPVEIFHVLEPKCNVPFSHTPCRSAKHGIMETWANNKQVQHALHIREGTKVSWVRCNSTVRQIYKQYINSSFEYHQSLSNELIHALIYSGDQDLFVPYVDTLEWIRKLNVIIIDDWKPWFVKGQVAGYTTKFSNGHYNLTYATVKGAGHTAPEYKPRECLHMFTNWIRKFPL